jgi:hypothetical protein
VFVCFRFRSVVLFVCLLLVCWRGYRLGGDMQMLRRYIT